MGKAVIFSLASLLIVILFVASSSLVTKFKIQESEIEITRTRVKIFNSIVSDLEGSYFEKLLYVSSKSALVGLTRYYAANNFNPGVIKKRIEPAIEDVMYQGILNEPGGRMQANLSDYIEYAYTLKGMTANITNILNSYGLEITTFNVSISSVDGIKQIDPWTIQVKGEFSYYISDKEGIASWKGFSAKTVNISVIGLTLYDRENGAGTVNNIRIVTKNWKLDNKTLTEDSVLSKIGGRGSGKGICVSYCEEN